MINFRYHLVSLVAVFLALALGIVIGSQVVDKAIVDGLRQQIRRVEQKASDSDAENSRLNHELDRESEYAESSAAFAVEGRLTGVPVAVVAERDVDGDDVEATAELVRRAGADTPVVVWLEPAWSLADADDRERLSDVVGLRTASTETLRAVGLRRLAVRLAEGPPADGEDDVLQALSDAGFVTIDGVDGGSAESLATWPGRGARAVLVGGTDADSGVPTLLGDLAADLDGLEVPVVLGEVYVEGDDAPPRGASVSVVRDGPLAATVSTVDDLDLLEGRVTAVVSLAELASGRVGHYGRGDGATRASPEWTGP